MTTQALRHGLAFGAWPEGMPSDPGFFRNFARRTEQAGFDILFSGDHVFHNAPLPECLISLADVAAVTQHIILGCSVLQLPMRDPSITAKQVATIDYLSGGRFIFGAGVGGEYEREWTAVDVDRTTRGKRMDEYLEIMQRLWKADPMSFDGAFRTIRDVTLTPTPAQRGGPPIWIGGRSDAGLKRASRFDGWVGYASSVRRTRDSVAKLADCHGGRIPKGFRIAMSLFFLIDDTKEKAVKRAGERLGQYYDQDFEAIVDAIGVVGTCDQAAERFQAYRDAGVTDFIWSPAVPSDQYVDQMHAIADVVGVHAIA
jgi:probable F420-dependent oxidoreductase